MKRRFNRAVVPISDLLGSFMQRRGLARGAAHRAVFTAWEKVVPDSIRARSTPVAFRGGELTVSISSAPLYEELRCFRAGEFLTLLNESLVLESEGVVVRKMKFRRV